VARPRCVYCDAALDPRLVPGPPAAAESAAVPAADGPARALVIVRLSVPADLIAQALGLSSSFEAELYARRGGWHLHRITAPADAEEEVTRLRGAGMDAHLIPEEETRPSLQPRLAAGGLFAGALVLRTDGGPARVRPSDAILAVEGAIQRERQPTPLSRKESWSSLEAGYRFHVHTRDDPRPIELDPGAFAFDEPLLLAASSHLELRTWVHDVANRTIVDDGFRFVPPALGLAAPPGKADLTRALAGGSREPTKAPPILDNLAQFRFYSGWRAAVERRSPSPRPPK
jgi:hypothetical protein